MDRLTHEQRKVYDLLVEKAKDHGFAKLAYSTIAQYTRLDVEMVKSCIRELSARKHIIIERVPESSNKYWINEIKPESQAAIPPIWVPEPKHYLFAGSHA
jgi:hypothetical protein